MAPQKKKSSKGKAPKQPKQPKGPAQTFLEQQQLLPPQQRMDAVRPYWLSLTPEDREQVLTVTLEDLRTYAKEQAARNRAIAEAENAEVVAAGHLIISLEPGVDERLDQGLERSKERGTWKIWQWPRDGTEFLDSDAFRKHLEESVLTEDQCAVLPKEPEGSKPLEKPAEAAFRQRMVDLMTRINEQRIAQEESAQIASRRPSVRRVDPGIAMRDAGIDIITTILNALEKEHEDLYQLCLFPVTQFVMELVPEGSRRTTKTELYPEDLEYLNMDDIHRIYDYLQEKVDAFSSRLKQDPKELEQEDPDEEPIGDVDLFSLTKDGTALCVNEKWLSHLRSRVLGEDQQPRKTKEGEDLTSAGLILEWVYGTIVSTAEKGRDQAHRRPNNRPPAPEEAVESLISAVEDQIAWEQHARQARELLAKMLASRKELAALSEQYDMRTRAENAEKTGAGSAEAKLPAEPAELAELADEVSEPSESEATASDDLPELPNDVILFMLQREILLTSAKLHAFKLEQVAAKRELRSCQAQLRTGEPQFERMKREVEELKAAPSRPLDGTYRSPAEMERQRAQLADAAIEEQMTVQTALRQMGSRLQKILETKQQIESSIHRRDQEATQLTKWRRSVCTMIDSLENLLAAMKPLEGLTNADGEVDEESGDIDDAKRALVAAVRSATNHTEELETLRRNFHESIRKQLYIPADDIAIFEAVQKQLKEIERRLEDGKVAVQHLLQFVINVACDDPGITIGNTIVLPYLQEKLDRKGLEWADQKAAAAQDEVIKMELLSEDKQRQEKEKKAKARLKAKEKARSEKERERADREAREREAREAEEEARRKAEAEVEEARRRRAEELEAIRRAEEELMEKRRRELLEDEDSYWRQRAQQEELLAAQAELEQELVRQALAEEADASSKEKARGGDDGFTTAGNKKKDRRSGKEKEKEPQRAGRERNNNSKGSNKDGSANNKDRSKQQQKGQKQATQPEAVAEKIAEASAPAAAPAASAPLPNGGTAWTTSPPAPTSPERIKSSSAPAEPDISTSSSEAQPQQMAPSPAAPPASPPRPAAVVVPPGAAPVPPPPPMAMVPPPGMLPPPIAAMPPPGMVAMPLPPPGAVPMPPPQVGVVPPHAVPAVRPHSRSGSVSGEDTGSPLVPHPPIPGAPPPLPPPYAPPPAGLYGAPPPPPPGPPPQNGPGMRPSMHGLPPHMFFPGGPPMVDGNGRFIRPPGFVPMHANGMMGPPRGPPPPPGAAGPMPVPPMGAVAMGQPVGGPPPAPPPHRPYPGHHRGHGKSFSSSFSGSSSRQLRAAAQPFVPSGVLRSASAASNRRTQSSTADEEKQHKEKNETSSPRGILLEPAELVTATATAGIPGAASDDIGSSASSSKAGSMEADVALERQASEDSPHHQGKAAAAAPPQQKGSAQAPSTPAPAGWQPPARAHDQVPAAAFEAGQQELMLAMVAQGRGHPAAAAAQPPAVEPPLPLPVVDAGKLKAVRGLSNSPGVYNCFLNVIIQSLWHLPAFRKSLLALTPADLQQIASTASADARVLISLRGIFDELSKTATTDGDDTPLKPVSPQLLREALAGSRFEHGDMHDAAEVLGELFDRLHAAEAGPGSKDPTLPRRVHVDAGQASVKRKAVVSGAAAGDTAHQPAAGSVWGNAAALDKVKRAPAPASGKKAPAITSMVQRLFGMEVQAPLGSENGANSPSGTSPQSSPATVEALQFTKFFHLVPAQGLRLAASKAPSFEAALVDATGGILTERLLTRPAVFTLSLVFESPQVPAPTLAATLAALRPSLDISQLFIDSPSASDGSTASLQYLLRCLVCYSSNHYFAFAFSEEVGQWLLLDDAHVSACGRWEDVQAMAAARRLQPSLLFYEAAGKR